MREIKFRAWDNRNKRFTRQFYVNADGKPYTYWDDPLPNALDIVLMQYTGLKDKNGREIYEGDVVQWKYREYQPKQDVRFAEGSFGVPTTVGHVPLIEYLHQDLEIIGNIYENPELLK